jgi:hypothetical protein
MSNFNTAPGVSRADNSPISVYRAELSRINRELKELEDEARGREEGDQGQARGALGSKDTRQGSSHRY